MLSVQSSELDPPSHPQASVAPPLGPKGGTLAHSLAGEGLGTPFRRRDKHFGTQCTVYYSPSMVLTLLSNTLHCLNFILRKKICSNNLQSILYG